MIPPPRAASPSGWQSHIPNIWILFSVCPVRFYHPNSSWTIQIEPLDKLLDLAENLIGFYSELDMVLVQPKTRDNSVLFFSTLIRVITDFISAVIQSRTSSLGGESRPDTINLISWLGICSWISGAWLGPRHPWAYFCEVSVWLFLTAKRQTYIEYVVWEIDLVAAKPFSVQLWTMSRPGSSRSHTPALILISNIVYISCDFCFYLDR